MSQITDLEKRVEALENRYLRIDYDLLLNELNRIARDVSPSEYGLPMYDSAIMDSMRLAIIRWEQGQL